MNFRYSYLSNLLKLKVFEEDFDVERQDRAKAQFEKDRLKEELELSRTENIKLSEKVCLQCEEFNLYVSLMSKHCFSD